MNDAQFEALVWARIDGTIDDMGLARLEAHLLSHPEAAVALRQIEAL